MTQRMNAMWNCKNPNQGKATKILCVCSAGLLRSPTIAKVLCEYGANTRSAGCQDYALIQVDEVLIAWADIIIFADKEHFKKVKQDFPVEMNEKESYICLDLPDRYQYNDPELVELIKEKLKQYDIRYIAH